MYEKRGIDAEAMKISNMITKSETSPDDRTFFVPVLVHSDVYKNS